MNEKKEDEKTMTGNEQNTNERRMSRLLNDKERQSARTRFYDLR